MKKYSFYTFIVSNFQICKQLTKFTKPIKKMNRKSTLLVVVVCVSGLSYSQNNTIFDSNSKQDISINNT